jgi:hypothetical protein
MPADQKQDRRKAPRITDKIRHSIVTTKVKEKCEHGEYVTDKAGENSGPDKMMELLHPEKMDRRAQGKTRCSQGDSDKDVKPDPQPPGVIIRKICYRAESEKQSPDHYADCKEENKRREKIPGV